MFRIKCLDKYLMLRFLELFVATLFICTFILLMQFLFKHITDIAGKGLSLDILGKFFYYATLSTIPLALPLAILLASLMTFGNLGEKMELTAMKAAGISLLRIMRSLTAIILALCFMAFIFSNNVLPYAQKKLWMLIEALRDTSPELEIPTGEFYGGINGFNIYVRDKGADQKLLKDLMIYDYSKGFINASVTVADSARLKMSADKMYLTLSLYNGESFENLKNTKASENPNSIPYRRENFEEKEVIIDFNANIAESKESKLGRQHLSQDITNLNLSRDSIKLRVDSIVNDIASRFYQMHFFDRQFLAGRTFTASTAANIQRVQKQDLAKTLNTDQKKQAIENAYNQAQYTQMEVENQVNFVKAEKLTGIRHGIEWHRKLTLPLACLIFFFIGAPLGAIIRKGGLGLPIVISVIMFIIYYLFDNTGYKLAREDVWLEWQGIWLSTACLLPIGIFFTYKAAIDAPILKSDTYIIFFDKIKKIFNKKK